MDNMQFIYIACFVVLFLWLVLLTFLYFSSVRHYKKLKVQKMGSLDDVMETVFKGLQDLDSRVQGAQKEINKIIRDNYKHIQHVSIKRFNPFNDTGSDQSFSAAFLDKNGDGVVISSLHGRNGTRIYAKPVEAGKAKNYELSQEEKEVVSLAWGKEKG